MLTRSLVASMVVGLTILYTAHCYTQESALQRTLRGHDNWVVSLAFSGDGKLLASASSDRKIKLWSFSTGRLQRTLEGHKEQVNSVAFSPNNKMVASGGEDTTIKLWEVSSGKVRATLKGH